MASTGKDKVPTSKPQLSWYGKNANRLLSEIEIDGNKWQINKYTGHLQFMEQLVRFVGVILPVALTLQRSCFWEKILIHDTCKRSNGTK